MHIGLVAPCSSGPLADLLPESEGVDLGCGAHFMATLVRALIDRGHCLSVITLSREIADPAILKGPNLTYYVYPMRSQRRMRDLYKVERRGLKEGILLAEPDILHAHWTYEFAWAGLETGLPLVLTSHDNAFKVLRFSKDLYRLGRLFIQLKIIRQVENLTAVSPYLAESLQWLSKPKIKVIPNPITVPNLSDNVFRKTADPPRVATILNGWGPLKNAKNAIKAFQLLRRKLPNAEMFMYGHDFEQGGVAARWTAGQDFSENTHFCGFLPPHKLQDKLKHMSVLLHPALEEACPLAVLEAMALGLPVIADHEAGGVPWVLDQGKGGFLTNMRDPVKIVKSLVECITQPEIRQQKQEYAYNRVLKVFSPDSVAAQYERVYEQVLAT